MGAFRILDENLSKYKKGWFACAVTRGYEAKVHNELEKLINHEHWGKYIYDIFVPMEIVKDKKGEDKKQIPPAYKGVIYINMQLTQEVYFMIKIDGFRTPLPAKDPVPIPEVQMEKVIKKFRVDD